MPGCVICTSWLFCEESLGHGCESGSCSAGCDSGTCATGWEWAGSSPCVEKQSLEEKIMRDRLRDRLRGRLREGNVLWRLYLRN
jgi:hypothetical protein